MVYGSFARGDWREGSDVDLLVVAEGLPRTYWERWDLLFAVVEGFPLDPHAYTPEEFMGMLADGRMTPIEALLDGVLVQADPEFYSRVVEELRRVLEKVERRRGEWVALRGGARPQFPPNRLSLDA